MPSYRWTYLRRTLQSAEWPRKTEDLLQVLKETRELLSKPGNDFSWSSWENSQKAVEEIGDIIARVESGEMPKREVIETLFAPAGPIQEVSLSSGWAAGFLILAEHFDVAVEKAYGNLVTAWMSTNIIRLTRKFTR